MIGFVVRVEWGGWGACLQVEALKVIHATSAYVVVEKPPGLLSVPGKGENKQDCAAARVRAMFPEATGPLVVHRLDMETSGLMVFGLTAGAQRALSMQFEQRVPRKRYVAVLDGATALGVGEAGEIRLPMRADIEHRPWQMIDYLHGRAAVTRYRVLGKSGGEGKVLTRIEFEPVTGRAHQLRLHAATARQQGGLGCPIVGDPLYGNVPLFMGGRSGGGQRLMLHAMYLALREVGEGGEWGEEREFLSEAGF